jgi:hypothetical protein
MPYLVNELWVRCSVAVCVGVVSFRSARLFRTTAGMKRVEPTSLPLSFSMFIFAHVCGTWNKIVFHAVRPLVSNSLLFCELLRFFKASCSLPY